MPDSSLSNDSELAALSSASDPSHIALEAPKSSTTPPPNTHVCGNDLLLVLLHADVWFQLPPELFVRRALQGLKQSEGAVVFGGEAPSFLLGVAGYVKSAVQAATELVDQTVARTLGEAVALLHDRQQRNHRPRLYRWTEAFSAQHLVSRSASGPQGGTTGAGISSDGADGELPFTLVYVSSLVSGRESQPSVRLSESEARMARPLVDGAETGDSVRGARVYNQLPEDSPSEVGWPDLFLSSSAALEPASIISSDTYSSGSVEAVWESMWFYPHARALMNRALVAASLAVYLPGHSGGRDNKGRERQWTRHGGRGGIWYGKEWLPWSDVCGSVVEEVFGDRKGSLNSGDGKGARTNEWGSMITRPEGA